MEEGSRNDELAQQIHTLQNELAKIKQISESFDTIKEEYEKQQSQLQVLREENEALSRQQEQGIKTSLQLERYKAKAKELQEQCRDVEQLKNELARLRKTESDFVQLQIDLQDLQGQLDTEKKANETLATKYSQIINENETLRSAKIGMEAETSRLRQILKESMIETNESSLKRNYQEDNNLIPLLEKNPELFAISWFSFFYRQSKLKRIQEERDKLEERVHVLEHDKEKQQTKMEVVVLKQQMEALERVQTFIRMFYDIELSRCDKRKIRTSSAKQWA